MNDLKAGGTSLQAILCLELIGEPAHAALKASAALTASDRYVREAATNALELIESKVK